MSENMEETMQIHRAYFTVETVILFNDNWNGDPVMIRTDSTTAE